MTAPDSRYATPAAFRAAVQARLRAEARSSGRPFNQLLREYLYQRFLARVFAQAGGPWVLKGGAGLLIRLPGARHSLDIDLLHSQTVDVPTAVAELRGLVLTDAGDHFRFVIGESVATIKGVAGATVAVTAYIGTTVYGKFSVDLSTDLHLVAGVERWRPTPIITVPDVPELPEFTLYPLPDQVADKACAMYQTYGDSASPSSRYRDLADLVLVATTTALDAAPTAAALDSEAHRRHITLPTQLHSPGTDWIDGYRNLARETSLRAELHDLGAALDAANRLLGPLLSKDRSSGRWNPEIAEWGD